MAFRHKKEKTQAAPLTDLQTALRAKIEKAESIEDPIDRLFAYKALRDATVGTFDETIADARNKEDFEVMETVGLNVGLWSGAAGGVVGGLALATVLTGGLAAIAAVPGAAILVGAMYAGDKLGKKSDQRRFNKRAKKLSPEAQQATNMLEMVRDLDKEISGLASSLSLEAMEKSSRLAELKTAFPEVATEFNRLAGIAAKKKEFLGHAAASHVTAAKLRL